MAKRFMHVSIGVLCLVAAYQIGARDARADWESAASGQIAGFFEWGLGTKIVFSESGEAWETGSDSWQGRQPGFDLPVPSEDIAFLGSFALITRDDVLWTSTGDEWTDRGSFPGGPVSLEEQSWGKTKAVFR